jgi:hypothetical protein
MSSTSRQMLHGSDEYPTARRACRPASPREPGLQGAAACPRWGVPLTSGPEIDYTPTPEAQEGRDAFLERRAPRFRGKRS